jgi:hypothetical protein
MSGMREIVAVLIGTALGIFGAVFYLDFGSDNSNPSLPILSTFTGTIVAHNQKNNTIDVKLSGQLGEKPFFDIMKFKYDKNSIIFERIFILNNGYVQKIKYKQIAGNNFALLKPVWIIRDKNLPTKNHIKIATIDF